MKKLLIYLSAAIGLITSGCGNGFLDVEPKNAVADTPNMIRSNAELQKAVNGAYVYLEFYRESAIMYGDIMGDDLQAYPWDYRTELYYRMMMRSANYTDTWIWRQLYSGAFDINTKLDKVQYIEDKDDDTDRMVAELKFIRAILHWEASRLYGPLPSNLGKGDIKQDALGVRISDKLVDDLLATYARDKVSDVFDFMINDMESLKGDLSTRHREAALNYWAAQMFLARLYLYTEQWDKAYDCAVDVIQNGGYTLYTRDNYVDSWTKEYQSESIFEMPTTESDNVSWDSMSYMCSPNGYNAIMATLDFVDLRDEGDVRFDILVNAWWDWFPEYWTDDWDWDYCYFITGKYPGRGGNLKVCNPKIYRLSEAYLIAAEAALRGSKGTGEGSRYLSELRRSKH